MQNKFIKAFTLAEILITLGIIGIVAEMTIPSLVADSQKKITVSKLLEANSILSQATVSINNECGGDITGCLSAATLAASSQDTDAAQDVANIYKAKLQLMKDCTDGSINVCFANAPYYNLNNISFLSNLDTQSYILKSKIITRNGIAYGFTWRGLTDPLLMNIFVDVNNAKSPNIIGKDTFLFYYDKNKKAIVPCSTSDCLLSGSGYGCAAKIIQEGAINYY